MAWTSFRRLLVRRGKAHVVHLITYIEQLHRHDLFIGESYVLVCLLIVVLQSDAKAEWHSDNALKEFFALSQVQTAMHELTTHLDSDMDVTSGIPFLPRMYSGCDTPFEVVEFKLRSPSNDVNRRTFELRLCHFLE